MIAGDTRLSPQQQSYKKTLADGCSNKPTLDLIRDVRWRVSPYDKHHPQKDTLYHETFKYQHDLRR